MPFTSVTSTHVTAGVSPLRTRKRARKPGNPRVVAAGFLRLGLPQTLGVESVALLSLLDGLATMLDDGKVFDGLRPDDAVRVAGAVAWLAVLGAHSGLCVEDVRHEAAVRGVRARAGLDGIGWGDRLAVCRAFFLAADAL